MEDFTVNSLDSSFSNVSVYMQAARLQPASHEVLGGVSSLMKPLGLFQAVGVMEEEELLYKHVSNPMMY